MPFAPWHLRSAVPAACEARSFVANEVPPGLDHVWNTISRNLLPNRLGLIIVQPRPSAWPPQARHAIRWRKSSKYHSTSDASLLSEPADGPSPRGCQWLAQASLVYRLGHHKNACRSKKPASRPKTPGTPLLRLFPLGPAPSRLGGHNLKCVRNRGAVPGPRPGQRPAKTLAREGCQYVWYCWMGGLGETPRPRGPGLSRDV